VFDGGFIAGLVGINYGRINYCSASVSIRTTTKKHHNTAATIGGLVGLNMPNATISASYATGSITGLSGDVAGGLVGSFSGTVSDSYATVAVSVVDGYAGGLVGDTDGTISNSYSTGVISDPGGKTGGLILLSHKPESESRRGEGLRLR
jgi:hypothetical protein